MYKNKAVLAFIFGLIGSSAVNASVSTVDRKPFYVGINGGFGSTTWRGLVPAPEKQNIAITASVPTEANEGGQVYGLYAGYELSRYFAIEASYRRYPRAKVTFAEFSIFAIDHEDRTSFKSDTDTANLMAKVMLTVPKTDVRVYSSFGVAAVHRVDELNKLVQASPTFGAGFNIDVSPRVMVDLGFNYTAGFGESDLEPSNDYIPFLYSATLGVSYRI